MIVVLLTSFDVPVSMDTVIVAKCLHYANSAINPILCVVLNKQFRRAVRNFMRKLGIVKSHSN